MKYPETVTLILRDVEVKCRYDYWPGEPQQWNGLTGVGHPGSEPEATVTEIFWCGGWEDAATELSTEEQQSLDEQLYERLYELEQADRDNEPAEREYE